MCESFDQDANKLRRFVESYDLFPFNRDPAHFSPIIPDPQSYVQNAWVSPPHVIEIIEALHAEIEGSDPVVLHPRQHWISGDLSGPGEAFPGPPAYCRLLRQLEICGIRFVRGKLMPIDSEAPAEQQDKSELASAIRRFQELDPNVIIHHIDESDSTFENGNWGASASEARRFFEGLVHNIATTEAAHRNEQIPNYPTHGQKKSSAGPCRNYLNAIDFFSAEDLELVSGLFSVASRIGSHPGLTDESRAKLLRRYCWVTGSYIVTCYSQWKSNGHKW